MGSHADETTTISRYYIDTRPLVPESTGNIRVKITENDLPLMSTFPDEIRISITRFLRPEDKFMSLASALLKFTYIHRLAKLPWSEIRISRTPKPHGRPYWDPPTQWHGDGFEGLEFNVSHQAGLVILAGCRLPTRPDISTSVGHSGTSVIPDPAQQHRPQIRIGVDVTCTKEGRRSPDVSTQAKLIEWIDTFAEMFSHRERTDMKERPVPERVLGAQLGGVDSASMILEEKARRFYTYWALKEAYIKMVGEGLLAGWLRQLEFIDVISPAPGERLSKDNSTIQVLFDGKTISDSVQVEIEGFHESFLFTLIARGLVEQSEGKARWTPLSIEDIRPCAEGKCSCLV